MSLFTRSQTKSGGGLFRAASARSGRVDFTGASDAHGLSTRIDLTSTIYRTS